MQAADEHEEAAGISAVLVANEDLDRAILDLAAVLDGLAHDHFEIILVGDAEQTDGVLADMRARVPRLPLVSATGRIAPRYELIFAAARDGQFDVRELNHLLEAVEGGADVAAGYRPRRTDGIVRQLQRWGWHVDVDCAFALFRRAVWQRLQSNARANLCAEMSSGARRLGFRVTDVPVSPARPRIDVQVSAETRAA
jgi:hypothetical protein